MNYGRSDIAEDLRLRQLLEERAELRSAAGYALDGLRMIARHAGTWADPDQGPRDPAEVLRTILAIAGDTASATEAMWREECRKAGRL